MASTPRGRRRIVLDDYKGKKRDEGAIDIETADGVFSIDPPELWSDEAAAAAAANDGPGIARALLGDKYDAFIAAGGSGTVIMSIIADEHRAPVGESDASSSS